jgi:hypothetical protein
MSSIDVFGEPTEQDVFGYDKELSDVPMPINIADETAGLITGLDGQGDFRELGEKFVSETTKLQEGNESARNDLVARTGSLNKTITAQAAIDASQDLPDAERADFVKEVVASTSESVDLEEELTRQLSAENVAQAPDDESRDIAMRTMAKTFEAWNTRAAVAERHSAMMAELSPSVRQVVTGIAMDIIPITALQSRHVPVAKTAIETLQKMGVETGAPLTGELVSTVRKFFNQLPEDQKEDFMLQLYENAQHNADLMEQSQWGLFTSMEQMLTEEPSKRDWDRIFENTGEILDAVMLGAGVKIASSIAKSFFKGNSVARAASKSPKTYKAMAAAMLKGGPDAQVLTKALGKNVDDIIEEGLPKVAGATNPSPTDILRNATNQVKADKILEKIDDTRGLWWNNEYENATLRILAENEANGLRGEKSGFALKDNGIMVEGFYGKNADFGYANKQAATMAARSRFPDWFEVVQDGEEWFIKADRLYNMKAEDAAILPEGSIVAGSRATKYWLDISSKFTKDSGIPQAWFVASDKVHFIKSELDSIADPFFKLRRKSMGKVVDKIVQGSEFVSDSGKVGKRFTRSELASELSRKEIQGYESFMEAQDVLDAATNRILRNQWKTEGYSGITNTRTNYTTAAKVLTKEKVAGRQSIDVYNPTNGTIETIKGKAIEDLYENGDSVGKLRFAETVGTKEAKYVMINKADRTKVADLPQRLINKIDGYYTRRYKDPYFIDEVYFTTKGGKNVRNTKTIGVASSRLNAQEKIANLKSSKQGVEFDYHQDKRVLNQATREKRDEEFLFNSGRLFFSPRKKYAISESTIDDPVESLVKSIQSVSRMAGMDAVMNKSKANWIKSFGKYTDGKFPTNADDIIKNAKSLTDPEVGKAVVYFDHIKLMEGVQDPFAIHWKTILQKGSEYLEAKGSKPLTTLARGLDKAGEASLFPALKTFSFLRNIAGYPSRQLLLQSTQPIMLSLLEPAYMTSRFWKDKNALDMGLLLSEYPGALDKYLKGITGLTPDDMSFTDMKALIKAFDESGIRQSIMGGHTYTAGMIHDWSKSFSTNLAGRATSAFRDAVMAPLKLFGKGFEIGEYNNLSSNFLIAVERAKKANPGVPVADLVSQSRYVDAIHADARGLGLAMNDTGQFAWQRGYLSLALQYQAINWKTGLLLAGKNKAFSNADLNKVRAMLGITYGSEGWGVGALVNRTNQWYAEKNGEPIPVAWRDFLHGGMVNLISNSLIDGRIDVSGSISPASGALGEGSWSDIILEMITGGPKSTMELFMGATFNNMKVVGENLSYVGHLVQTHDWSDPDLPIETVKTIAEIFPFMSNYSKSAIAAKEGKWFDRHGDPIVKATWDEAVAKAAFGFPSQNMDETYYLSRTAKQRARDLREDSELIYNHLRKDVETHKLGYVDGPMEIINQLVSQKVAILSGYEDERDREFVWMELSKRMRQDLRDGDGILNRLERNALRSAYGSESEFVQDITKFTRENYDGEQKAWLLDLIGNIFQTEDK